MSLLFSNRGLIRTIVEEEKILITMTPTAGFTVGFNLTFTGSIDIDFKDGGGKEALTSGIEKTHLYASAGTYIAEITGDFTNITKFIADNNRITFISGLKTGLLTDFRINNNLYVGALDMSNAPTSGLFWVDNNSGMTSIMHSSTGNAIITNYQYDGNDITGVLDLSNQPIGGVFYGYNNSNNTGITFASSGNSIVTGFRLYNNNLTALDLSNVPTGTLFYVYGNNNLITITHASSGNSVINDYRVQNTGLNSTLTLTNQPIGNIFWVHDTSALLNILFSSTGNSALVSCYCDDNLLQNIDFSNFPTSTPIIRLTGNSLTATEHDNQLINLDNQGWINGTLSITTGNTARTSASDTAYNNLIANGWTII